MNAFTDNATKTLTNTKILIALGVVAFVVSGSFVFGVLRFKVTDNDSSGGGGASPIALTSCRTITTSGSYYLSQNLTAPVDSNCFYISANDVTFDGNNKTVTVNKTNPANEVFAVEVQDIGGSRAWHNITIKNLNSNSGVRIFGDNINKITLDHLNVWEIANLGGDDVAITYNNIGEGGMIISGADQPIWRPYRTLIRNNTVTGGATTLVSEHKLINITTATHPCPRIDAIVDRNTITATHTTAGVALRIACATHTRVTNNTIRSTGSAMGVYLRDESDDGWYENNTVTTNTRRPALWLGSGNEDKTWPSRNTFRHNYFRSEEMNSFYALGSGSANVFTDNIFYTNNFNQLGSLGGYHGNTFNHNTFYNAMTGGEFISLAGNPAAGPPTDTFTNNIFSYSGNSVFSYDSWLPSRYDGDYNLFHNRAGALSFGTYGNLTAWRTATGDDAHSVNADPLLTNPPVGDFSTPTNSPAHNAASDGTDIGAR